MSKQRYTEQQYSCAGQLEYEMALRDQRAESTLDQVPRRTKVENLKRGFYPYHMVNPKTWRTNECLSCNVESFRTIIEVFSTLLFFKEIE